MSLLCSLYQLVLSQWQKGIETIEIHGLYEPQPIGFTFETVGWRILLVLVFVLLSLILFFGIRKFNRNKYRRLAFKNLEQLEKPGTSLSAAFIILKQTAITAFGREKAGGLSGHQWISFLDETGKGVNMLGFEHEISALLYQDQEPNHEIRNQIIADAKKWIKTHA